MIGKIGAAAIFMLASPASAVAGEPVFDLFAGFSVQPYSVFGYFGGVAAMNGNIAADGFVTRLAGGVGGYSYQKLPGVRQNVSQQMGDAMLGYQAYLGATRIAAYAGLGLQNFDNGDLSAAIRGASLGAKGQVEVYSPIGDRFFGFALGSLASNYWTYYTKAKFGYRITDAISFGPEGMAQGNTDFDQASVGGSFGFKLLDADWYLSAGYLWDLRTTSGASSDANGAYGQIGLSLRF